MADPLLKLSTLTDRPVIEIDKTRYEILSPDELSIVDSARFEQWGRRLSAVNITDVEPDDISDLSEILRKLTDWIMVGVPADVRDKLSEGTRLQIAEVFTTLFRKKQTAPTGKTKPKRPRRSIGAKPSPGSSGSTAAVPPSG